MSDLSEDQLVSTEQRNPITEDLDIKSSLEIVELIHREDQTVAKAVYEARHEIAKAIDWVSESLLNNGRLIYAGAGTSGRLGVLDAAECPPTFGTPPEKVVALIAGGETALTRAVEGAEDDDLAGAEQVRKLSLTPTDTVVGISSGSSTRFVKGALEEAQRAGCKTVLLTCSPLQERGDFIDLHIAAITGQEVIPGSTRMKAGTATKMILNMISTGAMVRSGRTFGNLMVDVSCSNEKLVKRGLRMIQETTNLDDQASVNLLKESNFHVKTAILMAREHLSKTEADETLEKNQGFLRTALKKNHTPNPKIKAIIFDMDGTILRYNLPNGFSAWAALGWAYGIYEEQQDWVDKWQSEQISYEDIWKRCALRLKGKKITKGQKIFFPSANQPPYARGFADCMKMLTPHYQTGILSSGITFVSRKIKKQFGMTFEVANYLGVSHGVFDGIYEIKVPLTSKADAFENILKQHHLNAQEVCYVGDSMQDKGVFEKVALPVLIHSKDPVLVEICRDNVIPDFLALPKLIENFNS